MNEYGETDVLIDLFNEIDRAYLDMPSIFDKIKATDMIIAFFPCTEFECQKSMIFRGEAYGDKNKNLEYLLKQDIYYHKLLSSNYERITKLAILCIRKGIKLIIENPANKPHYLTSYWALKPKVIDMDRTKNGDRQKKPTQYWFVGCEPANNLVFEPIYEVERRVHEKQSGKQRSEIHPQYAERFIKQYIAEYRDGKYFV